MRTLLRLFSFNYKKMVNEVTLIGNLGNDPEVRTTQNGRTVANFNLATSESFKNKEGERITNTEWHRVTAWSPLAEIIEKYVKKGSQIYLKGSLKTRSYEDKDGVKRGITEVVMKELKMLGGRQGSRQQHEPQQHFQEPTEAQESFNEDTLPF